MPHPHRQFRSLGGTVGLAQCSTVLNEKVDDYLKDLVGSGALTGPAASAVASTNANPFVHSLQSLEDLAPEVQTAIRDAFRYGLQWSFLPTHISGACGFSETFARGWLDDWLTLFSQWWALARFASGVRGSPVSPVAHTLHKLL